MKSRLLTLLLVLCGIASATTTLQAQVDPYFYDFPHNRLKWYTLESSHFMIHFQEGNSRSAQVVSRVAEEVYGPITKLYHHEPDGKVSIVLKDREDYSNGATYFFDNMIDIWVPPLNTPLRGTHDWYRNVISHEFTHIVQIQAAMKHKRSMPAIYFQWLSYEKVRRPDVLYGYPNGIVTLPFASVSVPAWLAEGTAQYQRTGFDYDTWDSHRDMILRTRILDNSQLGFVDMGTFASKTSLERETVYNQGFAFTIYLARRFGEDVLYKITHALSEDGVQDVNKAMKMATGIPGHELYDDWVEDRRTFYKEATAGLNLTPSEPVETKGFYNFYPQFLPDGKLAWLSNKGRDYSRVSLYTAAVDDSSSQEDAMSLMDLDHPPVLQHATFSCGNSSRPLLYFIETPFSFSDDGKWLVYTKTELNKFGEMYRDLYLYDRDKHKTIKQLTHDARAEAPALSPDGNRIAAVNMRDASINLVLYDREADSLRQLTHFDDGEMLFTPTWSQDGQSIYFAYADKGPRSIRRYDMESGRIEKVLDGPYTDYRDPKIGPDGLYLYYSANPDGIFNIYRMSLQNGQSTKLTSVLGGAFMPAVSKDGKLAFSEYKAEGYKLRTASLDTLVARHPQDQYNRPKVASYYSSDGNTDQFEDILNYNDSDIKAMSSESFAQADTGTYFFDLSTKRSSDDRSMYSYDGTITDFSFFPVIRFDNYTKINGSNTSLIKAGKVGQLGENLVRDFKAGVYFSSREVINRLNIFGGAMFGWGSRPTDGPSDFFRPGRLVDLDRDLFFTAEYQGLPFIDRYWSPTVSVELYNMHRNVKNGLTIEEFPCTSCLPDTSKTDIAYEIWEADLFLRSKLSKYSLLQLGAAYSPYRVSTDGFVSRELKQYVPGSTAQYFKGTRLSLAYVIDAYEYYRNSDIAPIGFKGFLQYTYNPSKLLDEYEINDGTLSPVYQTFKNHTVEAKGRFGFRLDGRKTAQVYSRFYSNLNNPNDYFFLDYIGGFTGLRSYPYFALGGNTTAFTELSYYTPLWTDINQQVGRFTLDKVYTRLFLEAGNGWKGPLDTGNQIKSGAGAELRFSFNGNYLFPLKLFVSGAYGFNKFSVKLPEDFITGTKDNRVSYGHDWMFHFGLTFDFEVLYDRFSSF